jgi:hypothetical protein
MTKVICDEAMRAKLDHGDEQVEVCDESGRTLGYFLPASTYERAAYEWANAEITDEELDRAEHEPGGYTTAEVLEYLKGL